jgi:hypothetical protein
LPFSIKCTKAKTKEQEELVLQGKAAKLAKLPKIRKEDPGSKEVKEE